MRRRPSDYRVLLVEDNPAHARVIQHTLVQTGIVSSIQTLNHGDVVMDYLTAGSAPGIGLNAKPDVILLDLRLPAMDADEVTRRIRADERLEDVPVVIVTASDDEADRERCLEAGATDYLLKPVSVDEARRAIERACDQAQDEPEVLADAG